MQYSASRSRVSQEQCSGSDPSCEFSFPTFTTRTILISASKVFQFMAAKDARTNLSLAETSAVIAKASKEDSAVMRTIALESKRDSSAMKTISILGMVFLPGTFIAASLFLSISCQYTKHLFIGRLRNARVWMGWWWCSSHQVGVQVLLGTGQWLFPWQYWFLLYGLWACSCHGRSGLERRQGVWELKVWEVRMGLTRSDLCFFGVSHSKRLFIKLAC